MSLESTDYLIDLLQELDEKYRGIYAIHTYGTMTRLDELGLDAFEKMAQIIDVSGKVELRMFTPMPDVHRVTLGLRSNDDTGLWDVYFEAGNNTDELNINHIIGELKEIYG